MSPAVGQNLPMPPRPSSSHSQQGIPPQSQQPPQQQINQGSNQGLPLEGQMGPQGLPAQPHMQGYPPHMQQMGSYKQMGPYPPQSQYSPQYAPRSQFPGYPAAGNQQGPPYSPGQNRPLQPSSHQGYPPHQGQHAVYPGPQNLWPPPPQNNPSAGMQNHIPGGKNIGPPHSQSPQPQQQPQPPPNSQQQQHQQQQPGINTQSQPQQQQPGGSPRQLNYLKQHLQHKGGYAQGSTPPPQSYGNGPAMPMGPPMPPSMGPPIPHGAVLQSHMENATGMNQLAPNVHHEGLPQDNGMPPHQVTSIVTTGPEGTQLDEASQQSTLSNTSIASGDETQSTPKNRKSEMFNHPMPPSHTNASPGPNHPHSGEENFEMGSPSWPRTPASPVFNNSHAPQTPSQEFPRATSKVKVSYYQIQN
jgi:AT-rich interactive domain-containing protein 1